MACAPARRCRLRSGSATADHRCCNSQLALGVAEVAAGFADALTNWADSPPSDASRRMLEASTRDPIQYSGDTYRAFRFNICALNATMTVLADMRTAAHAGASTIPLPARTPA